MATPLAIFSGRSNVELSQSIAHEYGIDLGLVTIKNFSDGEIYVKYEESIRGGDIYIIQSTAPPADNILELLLLLDAARRASAKRITAVIPYFGYARQDRKDKPRVSISAKLMADVIVKAGADRILAIDLHADQLQGFFNVPVDHLQAGPIFVEFLAKHLSLSNLVVVSPDVGGIRRTRYIAESLKCDLAMIDKRRPHQNMVDVMNVIGNVKGKNVLFVDDILDTGGTLINAAQKIKEMGALSVYTIITHPLLSGNAYEKIDNSCIDQVFVTNTLPLAKKSNKMTQLSVAKIFSDAIKRIHRNDSVSILFK